MKTNLDLKPQPNIKIANSIVGLSSLEIEILLEEGIKNLKEYNSSGKIKNKPYFIEKYFYTREKEEISKKDYKKIQKF